MTSQYTDAEIIRRLRERITTLEDAHDRLMAEWQRTGQERLVALDAYHEATLETFASAILEATDITEEQRAFWLAAGAGAEAKLDAAEAAAAALPREGGEA